MAEGSTRKCAMQDSVSPSTLSPQPCEKQGGFFFEGMGRRSWQMKKKRDDVEGRKFWQMWDAAATTHHGGPWPASFPSNNLIGFFFSVITAVIDTARQMMENDEERHALPLRRRKESSTASRSVSPTSPQALSSCFDSRSCKSCGGVVVLTAEISSGSKSPRVTARVCKSTATVRLVVSHAKRRNQKKIRGLSGAELKGSPTYRGGLSRKIRLD